MARPKSDQKRNSILAACQVTIIKNGISATTADIAKEAGIATGSLFTYFPTKTDLLNELYVVLKTEMVATLQKEMHGEDNKEKLHTAWTAWTNWAAVNSEKHQALELLRLSDQLTNESKQFGNEAIKPVFELINKNMTKNRTELSKNFTYELIDVISIKTMDKMAMYPDNVAEYREAGFEAVWNIISKE